MSNDDISARYYWCVRHNRVESDADMCPARYVLGPYDTKQHAANALQEVRERNEAWEAEDERWAGEER